MGRDKVTVDRSGSPIGRGEAGWVMTCREC